jgi:hypothetical protein
MTNDRNGVGLRISASGENPAEAAGPLWQTSSIKQMARAGQGGDSLTECARVLMT